MHRTMMKLGQDVLCAQSYQFIFSQMTQGCDNSKLTCKSSKKVSMN